MPPRKKNAAIKSSGATSSKAAPLPDWVKGGGAKPPPPTGTNRDGTAHLFPPRYKTPLNIMYERIQKLPGWLKPEVEPIHRKDGYTCVITLRKENKQDRSNPHMVRMEPKEPGARLQCETSLHAKHWGATYVLFRLFNQLGLHRVLPPGPREYWLELEQVKAQAPDSDSWKWASDPFEAIAKRDAEAAAREKEKAAREAAKKEPTTRPLSKAWQRAPEVRMAPALRELVESTIRARFSDAVTTDVDALDQGVQTMSLDKPALEKELTRLGVRAAYIRRGLHWLEEARVKYASAQALDQLRQAHPLLASILALPNREAAIEYMILFTPEQDLPPKLRPTASSDSFVTGAASGGVSQEGLVDRWTIDKFSRCAGFPRENVARALSMVRRAGLSEPQAAREGAVLDLLLHELAGEAQGQKLSLCECDSQKRQDERTMLEACLGDGIVRSVPENEAIDTSDYDIYLGTYDKEDVLLRVSLHPASHYLDTASVWPSVYVTSTTLPSFLCLALTRHVLQCFQRRADIRDALEANEGGVLFLVCEELKERIPAVLHDPPALSDVMEHLVDHAPNTAARALQQMERTRPRSAGPAVRRARPLERHPAIDTSLQAARDAWHASSTFQEDVRPVRESLPAHAARASVLECLRQHRVVLIAGETGCGKTTQVPQFLLDDAIEQGCGSLCSIVVTQPRRVSAMGVAARVAAERGESLDKQAADDALVGYAIRGERRASRACRLLFTTTGVLLRRMATGADADLSSLSHVIVDEVHERSIDSDFLLLLLRDVLRKNPTLRVVLMSATIQADTFTNYFGGAPYLEIPGRTFPVQTHYLERLVQATGYRTPLALSRDDERVDKLYETEALDVDAVPTVRALVASNRIDYGLLAATVAYAAQCARKVDGTGSLQGPAAILVFCPGVGEIRQAMDAIQALPIHSDLAVLPLHANLPPNEQRRVFQPVGRGQRKVVVATNVAETSITIPEVCYVIDTGRVREAQYDARAGVSRLLDTWASRAACRQRAGRAGRTMPGECFRLYTRAMERELQAAHSVPEMQRTPLEGVVLQVKAIQPDAHVRSFLSQALDPPSLEALDAAHTRLVIAGALHTEGGHAARLTPLGRHIATLPLDVRQAKLLILACLFECVEPLLHIAALVASRPIVAHAAARDEAAAQARAQGMLGHSDLLTHAHLFAQWLRMRFERRPGAEVRAFCEKHGLSPLALQEVALTRTTLLQQLEEASLVDRAYVQGYRAQGPAWPARSSSLAYDTHSRHTNLLRSLLLAAMWPSVVRVDQPAARYHASASGAVRKEAHAKELHYFDEHDGRVFLHPSSLLFHATECQSGYVAVLSKSARGLAGEARTYVRDATEVPLYAILLFGGPLYVDHEVGGLTVSTGVTASADAWVRLRANPRIGVLCRQLRQLLDRMLEEGIEDPHALIAPHHQPIVQAMLALLQQDGLAAP
ncbi:RNA helicase [Malassezia equina]|uniref:RNA helicase n=1 Tax=Malassezia equina TaxID=1381935 RepID=A0AAF0EAP5_9BASI|nr:RNA helicase [Malassezia equina]